MTREEEIKNEAKLKCHDIASEVDYKSSAAYDGFLMGAEWADKTMIEKACKWFDSIDTDKYMDSNIFQMSDLIRDFKKAMEK